MAFPDKRQLLTEPFPEWWIVIASVVAGLLVLVVICLILWRLGFFVRKLPDEIDDDSDLMLSAHFEKVRLNGNSWNENNWVEVKYLSDQSMRQIHTESWPSICLCWAAKNYKEPWNLFLCPKCQQAFSFAAVIETSFSGGTFWFHRHLRTILQQKFGKCTVHGHLELFIWIKMITINTWSCQCIKKSENHQWKQLKWKTMMWKSNNCQII